MNEMREIETTIRSWNLRQPSACVSDAIFGAEACAEPPRARESHAPLAFRWLVPATAGLLLLCVMANPRGTQGLSGSTNGEPMMAMILSNQSSIPYLPGSFKADENNVPADTFEWTNVSGSNSSIRSLRGVNGRH
jgi:hypothetical protein